MKNQKFRGERSLKSLFLGLKSVLALVLILVAGFYAPFNAEAQHAQIVPVDNHAYKYIKLLQQRGFLSQLNPTEFPYNRGEIQVALDNVDQNEFSDTDKFWARQIRDEVGYSSQEDEIYLYGMLEGGFDLNNTLNGNGLRPQAHKPFFIPNGASNLYAEKDHFAAQMGLRHNLFYDMDRRGINSLSRYYVRNEDYFIGFNSDFVDIYAGRYENLWAPYGETSTVLGTNPRSYDHLSISLEHSWFSLSSIFAELDNLGKDGTFERGGKNLIDGTKRYLAIHRIDLKINDGLRLGFFDGFIYSSQNSVPSLKFMSPVNFFFFERNTNPLNNEFNAFFGGMIWGHYRNVTANLQLMIDDIVIKEGKLRTEIEPTTFALTYSTNFSGITDFMDAGIETEFVAYQTYNTDQAEGRYLFLNRGIANQFTDYAYGNLYVKLHAHKWISGLTIEPSFSYLAQGEQEINQDFVDRYPNGEVIDVILSGTEEKMSRVNLNLFYNPIPEFWIESNIGYNYLSNKNHILGNSESRITASFEAGFRLSIDN